MVILPKHRTRHRPPHRFYEHCRSPRPTGPSKSAAPVSGPSESNELATLIGLFYRQPEELGKFAEVGQVELPPVYAKLLAHQHHMTVAMERHHGGPVKVRVLNT